MTAVDQSFLVTFSGFFFSNYCSFRIYFITHQMSLGPLWIFAQNLSTQLFSSTSFFLFLDSSCHFTDGVRVILRVQEELPLSTPHLQRHTRETQMETKGVCFSPSPFQKRLCIVFRNLIKLASVPKNFNVVRVK